MTPTPEQVEAAESLEEMIRENGYDAKTVLLPFLAARDAAHAREVAELNRELTGYKNMLALSREQRDVNKDRAKKAEASSKDYHKKACEIADQRDRAEAALAAMTRERDDFRVVAKVEADEADRLRELADVKAKLAAYESVTAEDQEVKEAFAVLENLTTNHPVPVIAATHAKVLARALRVHTAALREAEAKIAALEKKS